MNSSITPLILTYNEESNIARVLERLTTAAEVVIVDSMSTDGTTELARQFANVRIVSRPFDDHTSQWNFGLSEVRTEWVLSLDADYVISETLIEELRDRPGSGGVAAYQASFRFCIEGQPLMGSLYPSRVVLFRREAASYVADGHTQRLSVQGRVGQLQSLIDHDDRKPLASWLAAQGKYARLEFEKLFSPVRTVRTVDRLRKLGYAMPFVMPLYCLVGKRLIFDGKRGLFYTFQRTYFELLLALMVLQRRSLNRRCISSE